MTDFSTMNNVTTTVEDLYSGKNLPLPNYKKAPESTKEIKQNSFFTNIKNKQNSFFTNIKNKLNKNKYENTNLELNINNYAERVVKNANYKINAYFDSNVTLPVFYNSKLFDLVNSVFKTSFNNDATMTNLLKEYQKLISLSPSSKDFYKNMKQTLRRNLEKHIIDVVSDVEHPLISIKISNLIDEVFKRIENIDAIYRSDNPIDELVNLYIVHKMIYDRSNPWLVRIMSPLKYIWNLYPSTKIALFLVIIIYILLMVFQTQILKTWFSEQLIKKTSTKVLVGIVGIVSFMLVFVLKPIINIILPEYLTDKYYVRQSALVDAEPQLNMANDDEMMRSKCTINNRGTNKEINCDLLRYLETGPQGVLKTAIKVVNQHAAEMTKLHQGAFKNIEEIAQGNFAAPNEQNLPPDRPAYTPKDFNEEEPAYAPKDFNEEEPAQSPP